MDFDKIDWNAMWKKEIGRSHFDDTIASKEIWDKRADGFSKRINRVMEGEPLDKDDYISKMLNRIEVKPDWTVLDIGCGPGTLTIPLAKKAKSVTALDISSEMLKNLKLNAEKIGLNNVSYINSSWQDAFTNGSVAKHDVVVASRSLMGGEMKTALSHIIAVAGRAAYLTFPVVHLPFDFEVFKAIGRNKKKHPPYIYLMNMLYQMGVTANVELLYSKVVVQFKDFEDAVKHVAWRTDPFTPKELEKFEAFFNERFADQKTSPVLTHEGKSVWALIWWRVDN
ncbi:MAG: methyltransferase domain-containing protein [Dehalococcoidales bacterium]|nr:methyltransferase domain-containing protein [Dehalococcoidales bacterium]